MAIPLFCCNLPLFALSFLPFHYLPSYIPYPFSPFILLRSLIPLCSLTYRIFPHSFPFFNSLTKSFFPFYSPFSLPSHIVFPLSFPFVHCLTKSFFPFHSPLFTALPNIFPLSFPFAPCLPITFFLFVHCDTISFFASFIPLCSLPYHIFPLILLF